MSGHDAPPARTTLDLSVYLVTDTQQCGERGVVDTVRAAVGAGATIIQVRDPHASEAELVALTRECVAAVADLGLAGRVPIIVNDRADLAAEAGADGAHVGQSDLDAVTARRLIGPDGILGLSVHTMDELDAAKQLPPGTVDYLGIGPLRPTLSKADHAPARGLAHLGQLAAASPWPCVAIGGVGAADAGDLARHGIAGMAVISAICGQPDVEAATEGLVRAWADAAAAAPGGRPS